MNNKNCKFFRKVVEGGIKFESTEVTQLSDLFTETRKSFDFVSCWKYLHTFSSFLRSHVLRQTSRGRIAINKSPPTQTSPNPHSAPTRAILLLVLACYFLFTPEIYFITQTILIRAPRVGNNKKAAASLVTFVPKLIRRLLPERDGKKGEAEHFFRNCHQYHVCFI